MSTLQIIRKFAFTAVLAAAALIAPATQAADECVHEATACARHRSGKPRANHCDGTAHREAGRSGGKRPRETAAAFADLGTMTVHASRDALATVADLGTMTVTAPSQGAVIVAGGYAESLLDYSDPRCARRLAPAGFFSGYHSWPVAIVSSC